mgnify:CR=1 FL=1
MDEAGRTNRTIAAGHKDAAVGRWVKTHGAFLERYALADGPPIHASRTSVTLFGKDVDSDERLVCAKKMRHRHQFEAEVRGRYGPDDKALSASAVVSVLGWHMPAGESLSAMSARMVRCANLGHPCGKLVMQHGKCETP